MRLVALNYSESIGRPEEWTLEGLTLGTSTLVVGKNTVGKSRTLNVINALAGNLLGELPPGESGEYHATFDDDGRRFCYRVKFEAQRIIQESVEIDGELLLDRGDGGRGKIRAERMGPSALNMEFQTAPNEFAAAVRRDAIQHSFLEPLFEWASTLRFYQFGSDLGKFNYAMFVPGGVPVNERDMRASGGVFRNGKRDFGTEFVDAVIRDLRVVGYDISEIDIGQQVSIRFDALNSITPVGLFVRERDLPGVTDQGGMSQGMWRTVALLVHVNYLQFRGEQPFIVIDDIGEGLDFERSCKLIGLLRRKAQIHNIQIVFSSNDRFVMNEVPLSEWAVLVRTSNHVTVRNQNNSREVFEEFRFTGLSNFSFLEMGMIDTLPH